MAFSGNFLCTSFKTELMKGVHNFTASSGNTFNVALYDNSASFNAATTAYTSSNEISGTNYSCQGSGTCAGYSYSEWNHGPCRLCGRGVFERNNLGSSRCVDI